jgi:hypothetical protein
MKDFEATALNSKVTCKQMMFLWRFQNIEIGQNKVLILRFRFTQGGANAPIAPLRDLDPVATDVQVPPVEPRGRRRSADADVGVDPLFGVQFWRTLRGEAADPQSALGSEEIVAPASPRRLHHDTTPAPTEL